MTSKQFKNQLNQFKIELNEDSLFSSDDFKGKAFTSTTSNDPALINGKKDSQK
ncbi:hypothetical protein PS15m_000735 [Mucor circinelloides]